MTGRWFALHVRVPFHLSEATLALLWEQPVTGLQEEGPGRFVAFSRSPWVPEQLREDLLLRLVAARDVTAAALQPERDVEVTAVTVEEEDWLRRWKEGWRPTPLGRGLLVVPAWWREPIESPRTRVWIDPGQAFGTGAHVTTALAWEFLEELVEEGSARRLLDVGTGSGILALAALAAHPTLLAVGTEADPGALVALRTNLRVNDPRDRFLPVLTAGVPFSDASFDRAVANLTELEHRSIEAELSGVLVEGGHVVLSGLLEHQGSPAEDRWRERGYRPVGRRSRDGWVALRLQRIFSNS